MLQMNNSKPSFIVDAMLGNLAKKLRLMGFDSIYFAKIEDSQILHKAKNENRVILTRDRELIRQAEKQAISAVQINSDNEMDQFFQINEKIKLGNCIITGNTSRCVICNGELHKIEKESINDKIPKGVLEIRKDFWFCQNCNKIYWEGTHIENLQKFLVTLNERL